MSKHGYNFDRANPVSGQSNCERERSRAVQDRLNPTFKREKVLSRPETNPSAIPRPFFTNMPPRSYTLTQCPVFPSNSKNQPDKELDDLSPPTFPLYPSVLQGNLTSVSPLLTATPLSLLTQELRETLKSRIQNKTISQRILNIHISSVLRRETVRNPRERTQGIKPATAHHSTYKQELPNRIPEPLTVSNKRLGRRGPAPTTPGQHDQGKFRGRALIVTVPLRRRQRNGCSTSFRKCI